MTSVAAIPSEEGLTAKANTSDHSERQQDCQNGQKTTDDPNGRVRSHGSGVPFLTGSARCCTQPLSKYELVRALGARAAQLARGKRALVMVPGVLDPLEIARAELDAGIAAFELFRRSGLAASGGEARRLIKGGGARVNDAAIAGETQLIGAKDLTGDGFIKLSAGKKRHALVRPA